MKAFCSSSSFGLGGRLGGRSLASGRCSPERYRRRSCRRDGLWVDSLECLVLRAGWAISSGCGLIVVVAGITSRNARRPGAEGDRAVEGEAGGL